MTFITLLQWMIILESLRLILLEHHGCKKNMFDPIFFSEGLVGQLENQQQI